MAFEMALDTSYNPPELSRPRLMHSGASGNAIDSVLLRNIGGKPVRFRGVLLAEGSNFARGLALWHDIALYRVDGGQVAVALRLKRPGDADLGVHRARVFEDLDAACSWLEHFDCTADLAAEFDVSDPTVSAARVTVQAAALRERAERLQRGYRGLVGEILFRLEAEQ